MMIYVPNKRQFDAIIAIPGSEAGDAVTYSIIRASDGSEFDSGSAVHIAENLWQVSFTPTVLDVYIIIVIDSAIDSTKEMSVRAIERVYSKHLA